jgi:DNA-binding response OmpR family regulator
MQKILLVEDNASLAETVSEFLEMEGFTVAIEDNGAVAEKRILAENPDLVILDLMLPGKDGISICRDIRHAYSGIILMFTAKEEEVDQIVGLEVGADDYLIKPVRPRLLLAKVRSLLRRGSTVAESGKKRVFGELQIDDEERLVTLNGTIISLTSMEFELLSLLTSFPGEILSRDFIAQRLKGRDHDGLERSTDNAISQLRRKLQDSGREPKRIKTIRGKGYIFIPAE